MTDIKIEAGFFTFEPDHSVSSLCWLAREILGAYMDEGSPLDLGDSSEEDLRRQFDDDGDEVDLIIHETEAIHINKDEIASLNNLPWIEGPGGLLIPYPEPGHVALRIDAIKTNPGSEYCLGNKDRQFVFRTPNSSTEDEAAIFAGWSLDEAAKIPSTDEKRLKNLAHVLHCVRQGYRNLMDQESAVLAETYLSTVPHPSLASIIDKGLSGLG